MLIQLKKREQCEIKTQKDIYIYKERRDIMCNKDREENKKRERKGEHVTKKARTGKLARPSD